MLYTSKYLTFVQTCNFYLHLYANTIRNPTCSVVAPAKHVAKALPKLQPPARATPYFDFTVLNFELLQCILYFSSTYRVLSIFSIIFVKTILIYSCIGSKISTMIQQKKTQDRLRFENETNLIVNSIDY